MIAATDTDISMICQCADFIFNCQKLILYNLVMLPLFLVTVDKILELHIYIYIIVLRTVYLKILWFKRNQKTQHFLIEGEQTLTFLSNFLMNYFGYWLDM